MAVKYQTSIVELLSSIENRLKLLVANFFRQVVGVAVGPGGDVLVVYQREGVVS